MTDIGFISKEKLIDESCCSRKAQTDPHKPVVGTMTERCQRVGAIEKKLSFGEQTSGEARPF
jgi:hypothetical protein